MLQNLIQLDLILSTWHAVQLKLQCTMSNLHSGLEGLRLWIADLNEIHNLPVH